MYTFIQLMCDVDDTTEYRSGDFDRSVDTRETELVPHTHARPRYPGYAAMLRESVAQRDVAAEVKQCLGELLTAENERLAAKQKRLRNRQRRRNRRARA